MGWLVSFLINRLRLTHLVLLSRIDTSGEAPGWIGRAAGNIKFISGLLSSFLHLSREMQCKYARQSKTSPWTV